ncbi:MAG: hypothetical protein ACP5HJ_02940 [Candidatus Micrarchaeia archaeon]
MKSTTLFYVLLIFQSIIFSIVGFIGFQFWGLAIAILLAILMSYVELAAYRKMRGFKFVLLKDFRNPHLKPKKYLLMREDNEINFYNSSYALKPAIKAEPYFDPNSFAFDKTIYGVAGVSGEKEDDIIIPISIPLTSKVQLEKYVKDFKDFLNLNKDRDITEKDIAGWFGYIEYQNPTSLLQSKVTFAQERLKNLATSANMLMGFWEKYAWLIPLIVLIFVVVLSTGIYLYMLNDATKTAINSIVMTAKEAIRNMSATTHMGGFK